MHSKSNTVFSGL